MSRRELVVLGTASQVPTRTRNHNGYVLFWDDEAVLFDPGEGTQRQMLRAGVSATDLTRIAITHLHGDHSLGLAGVVQRISLDGVPHTVPVSFPASGATWVDHLLDATSYHHRADLALQPLSADGVVPPVGPDPGFTLRAERLDHGVEAQARRGLAGLQNGGASRVLGLRVASTERQYRAHTRTREQQASDRHEPILQRHP